MNTSSYILGNEVLLYSESNRSIYRLNPSAGFIWCCYEEGIHQDQIVSELVKSFGIPQSQARNDVEEAFEEWNMSGLLNKGEIRRDLKPVQTPSGAHRADVLWTQTKRNDYAEEHWYRLFNQIVQIRFTDLEVYRDSHKPIESLEIAARNDQPDHCFTVIKLSGEYALYYDHQLQASCEKANELAPLLLAQVISTVYLNTVCLMGLHAAAVGLNNKNIILPAMSGSGKSTLTAALVASGFDFHTDELVLITHDSDQFITAHVGIGLKTGSWPILKDFFPDLATSPTYHRQDGKQVRYLTPACTGINDRTDLPKEICALIFPMYSPGQSASASPISTADALCRLAEAGYDVKGGLARDTVEKLIVWLDRQECYELPFDDLTDAISEIRNLIS